jgi:hypothetical protein
MHRMPQPHQNGFSSLHRRIPPATSSIRFKLGSILTWIPRYRLLFFASQSVCSLLTDVLPNGFVKPLRPFDPCAIFTYYKNTGVKIS